jgi:hypothetical protein
MNIFKNSVSFKINPIFEACLIKQHIIYCINLKADILLY